MSDDFELAVTYLSDEAIEACREAIRRHKGHEVFWVGRFDRPGGLVAEVEVLCQGNAFAVPALLDRPQPGEVVIHNHPSGRVLPSGPDIQLASHFGNNDVAFFIVDNRVERICAVVKPLEAKPRVDVLPEDIEAALGPEGSLAKTLKGFEPRSQQVQMAQLVAQAFNKERLALIEAGTGTGKSLAYLVPAALWALSNEGRVLIATHTINLQEQLSSKDIPLMKRLEGMGIEAAVLKGRGNYLCVRKLEQGSAQTSLFDDSESTALASLNAWAKVTDSGTRSDLSQRLPEGMWPRVAADGDDCGRVQCPAYDRCFYYTARRKAAGARLLIVNHHLLIADLFLRAEMGGDYKRSAVLPPSRHVILDEAHHLEDVATSFGSGRFSAVGVGRLLSRLYREKRKKAAGLLPALMGSISDPRALDDPAGSVMDAVHQRIVPAVGELRRILGDHLEAVAVGLEEELRAHRGDSVMRIRAATHSTPFWVELAEPLLSELVTTLESLVKGMTSALTDAEKLDKAETEPTRGILLDISGVRNKLRAHARTLRAFMTDDGNMVRWMELDRGRGRRGGRLTVRLNMSPIDVSSLLHDRVFKPMKTVVLTSATLAAGGSFDYLRGRLGLSDQPPARSKPAPGDPVVASRLDMMAIPSPFDLGRQVFLGVPTDLPSPNSRQANPALTDLVEAAVRISDGGAFVLFTSYASLEAVHRGVSRSRLPYELLKQGSAPRSLLLDRFKAEDKAVLFGADSFWEGVDVQGDSLRLVIITRLPFRVPSEPVLEARSEALQAAGGDPFRELSLPQAVLRFKQGFGRLIRHRDDWGAVIVADSRIINKRYGRKFLAAIPQVAAYSGRTEDVVERMAHFFRREG